MLELHEKINVPSLLINAEAWDLTMTEQKEIEQIETSTLKSLFNLPLKTPTPAIFYTFGLLYTDVRIHKRQLLYLHRILNRDENHWTNKTLMTLKELNIGWFKSIKTTLVKYELEQDFTIIKNTPSPIWKNKVIIATEKANQQKLIENSHKKEGNMTIPKTKTSSIIRDLESRDYRRRPTTEILNLSKNDCKTLIISRFGMLECGINYKGTMNDRCMTCDKIDNEEHRLNSCKRYENINFLNNDNKIPFRSIYSEDPDMVQRIILHISKVWNTKTGNGSMNLC